MLNKIPLEIKEEIITCLKTYDGAIATFPLNNEFDVFEINEIHHKLTIQANEKECKVFIDGELRGEASMNDKKSVSILIKNTRKMFDETLKIAISNS
jgi:hypothetical protein